MSPADLRGLRSGGVTVSRIARRLCVGHERREVDHFLPLGRREVRVEGAGGVSDQAEVQFAVLEDRVVDRIRRCRRPRGRALEAERDQRAVKLRCADRIVGHTAIVALDEREVGQDFVESGLDRVQLDVDLLARQRIIGIRRLERPEGVLALVGRGLSHRSAVVYEPLARRRVRPKANLAGFGENVELRD